MSDAALPTDVLLDTHAFLWFALGDERMSPTARELDGAHRDPFDRMLAAQAILRDLPLVSNDSALDAFGVRRSW